MRYLLLAFVLLVGAAPCFADWDYKCMSDCYRSGSDPAFCEAKCAYNKPTAPDQPKKKEDLRCVIDCVQAMHAIKFCEEKCSY